MPIRRVGHVVLKVRDLNKARRFYCDFLGMTIGNASDRGMFLRFNDYHHDIAIFKTGDDAEPPRDNQVGLVHVALICSVARLTGHPVAPQINRSLPLLDSTCDWSRSSRFASGSS